jgi:hypothetical protein
VHHLLNTIVVYWHTVVNIKTFPVATYNMISVTEKALASDVGNMYGDVNPRPTKTENKPNASYASYKKSHGTPPREWGGDKTLKRRRGGGFGTKSEERGGGDDTSKALPCVVSVGDYNCLNEK